MSKKNPYFDALEKVGRPLEESALSWVQSAAALDFLFYETMEEALGARQAHIIYSRVWEKLALMNVDHTLAALEIPDKSKFTLHDFARLSKIYWDAIDCPTEITETPDRVEVKVFACPYYDNMKLLVGEDRAHDMLKKGMGATTSNYYQAITKYLGKWDEIYATQDRCICLGDEYCRVVFQRRGTEFKDMTENI
jgi:hypothetical protein